ncbi:MAG: metal-sensitive transcriptional regulator [Patescibacteria group bacterium]
MKHQSIYNRLRRIEGQVRGIEDMLDKERPAEEILIQLEAARSGLSSTISALVGEMLEKDGFSGKVALSEIQVRALLRSVKRS